MTDENGQGGAERPNATPELSDAIRSIDAIGENARGVDDDQDATREDDDDQP